METRYSYEAIKEAYDAVLNYLTLPFTEFSTGQFTYSDTGARHFADVKSLFNLNAGVLFGSAAVLVLTGVLVKKKKIALCRPFGHSSCLFSAIILIVAVVILAGLIVPDFDRAYTAFHEFFFEGRTWVFNKGTDPIITIMPEEFFMNCAILIGVALAFFCVALVVYDGVTYKKHKAVIAPDASQNEGGGGEMNWFSPLLVKSYF